MRNSPVCSNRAQLPAETEALPGGAHDHAPVATGLPAELAGIVSDRELLDLVAASEGLHDELCHSDGAGGRQLDFVPYSSREQLVRAVDVADGKSKET